MRYGSGLLWLLDRAGSCGLESLEFMLGLGEGTLQAALILPDAVEERELEGSGDVLFEEAGFGDFPAGEFPLRDGHLLDVDLLGLGLRLPFGLEIIAETLEIFLALAGEDDGTGAKAVTKGVHAGSGLSLGGFGAGGFLRVAAVGVDLLLCGHIRFRAREANSVCVAALFLL